MKKENMLWILKICPPVVVTFSRDVPTFMLELLQLKKFIFRPSAQYI